jgi:ubiquinone/menaquinone biosynthesis C-methylase UbiE
MLMTERNSEKPDVGHPSTDDRSYLPAMGHDALLPLYDPLTRLLGVGGIHRRLLDRAGIGPGTRVLEIGCGTANLLLLAAHRHPRATLIGLDPDPAALALARRKADRRGRTLRLDQGYAGQLPYPDATVDRVLSAFMLHHLPEPEKLTAMREVHRVLAPGGSLHLVDFDGHGPHAASVPTRLFGHRHRGHGHGQGHQQFTRNSSAEVRDLLGDAGLVDVAEVGRGRAILGRYVCYRAVRR